MRRASPIDLNECRRQLFRRCVFGGDTAQLVEEPQARGALRRHLKKHSLNLAFTVA